MTGRPLRRSCSESEGAAPVGAAALVSSTLALMGAVCWLHACVCMRQAAAGWCASLEGRAPAWCRVLTTKWFRSINNINRSKKKMHQARYIIMYKVFVVYAHAVCMVASGDHP